MRTFLLHLNIETEDTDLDAEDVQGIVHGSLEVGLEGSPILDALEAKFTFTIPLAEEVTP